MPPAQDQSGEPRKAQGEGVRSPKPPKQHVLLNNLELELVKDAVGFFEIHGGELIAERHALLYPLVKRMHKLARRNRNRNRPLEEMDPDA